MAQLGSIYDDQPRSARGTKGPDLRVEATVPRSLLDSSSGLLVDVPDRVPHEGSTVPRNRQPDDPPGAIRLFLSSELGPRSTLRLRGQGGKHPQSGVAGDLLLTVIVDDSAVERSWLPLVVVAMVVVAAAAAWATYGKFWGT